MEELSKIRELWEANDELWSKKVFPRIIQPILSHEVQFSSDQKAIEWEVIVAAAFENSCGIFEAVQKLCNPNDSRQFWTEGLILTRSLFETYVTLNWVETTDREQRRSKFIDDYKLKCRHFLVSLKEKSNEVDDEIRKKIVEDYKDVLKRRKLGPGTLSCMLGVQNMVEDLVKEREDEFGEKNGDLKGIYEVYYRDVSNHVHPSGWGLLKSLSYGDNTAEFEPPIQNGVNALQQNCRWFLGVLNCHNSIFKTVEGQEILAWLDEWHKKSSVKE